MGKRGGYLQTPSQSLSLMILSPVTIYAREHSLLELNGWKQIQRNCKERQETYMSQHVSETISFTGIPQNWQGGDIYHARPQAPDRISGTTRNESTSYRDRHKQNHHPNNTAIMVHPIGTHYTRNWMATSVEYTRGDITDQGSNQNGHSTGSVKWIISASMWRMHLDNWRGKCDKLNGRINVDTRKLGRSQHIQKWKWLACMASYSQCGIYWRIM